MNEKEIFNIKRLIIIGNSETLNNLQRSVLSFQKGAKIVSYLNEEDQGEMTLVIRDSDGEEDD